VNVVKTYNSLAKLEPKLLIKCFRELLLWLLVKVQAWNQKDAIVKKHNAKKNTVNVITMDKNAVSNVSVQIVQIVDDLPSF
jgi:hypothetical protein